MSMTWNELAERIQQMTPEQRDAIVCFLEPYDDEICNEVDLAVCEDDPIPFDPDADPDDIAVQVGMPFLC